VLPSSLLWLSAEGSSYLISITSILLQLCALLLLLLLLLLLPFLRYMSLSDDDRVARQQLLTDLTSLVVVSRIHITR